MFQCLSLLAIKPPGAIGDSSNIILWLHPDSGVFNSSGSIATIGQDVAEWRDLSGNGFVFTNAYSTRRPVYDTLDNQNYLNFTSGDFFENTAIKDSINGLTEFSMFFTIKSDVIGTDQGFLDSEDPNNTDDKICLRYDKKNANINNCINAGLSGNTANNQVQSKAYTQTTNVQVIAITWKSGERLKMYIDGILNDSSSNTISTALSGVSKIIIGKGPKDNNGGLGGGSGWDGLIGQIVFYNKLYSSDTIQIVTSEISAVKSIQTGMWSDTATWDCSCVPKAGYDITVSTGHTVTLDSSVYTKNLTIQSGGTLDLSSFNYDVDISGHLNVSGSLTQRQSTLSFSGTEASLITGTFTAFRMDIDKTAVSVQVQSGGLSIEKSLNINSGIFDSNGLTTLLSSSTSSANLGEVNGSLINNMRIQCTIDGMASLVGYRQLSSPIQNSTINDFQYDSTSHVGGIFTYGFTGSNLPGWWGYKSTYSFNEDSAVSNSDFNSGWIPASSSTNSISYSSALTFYGGGTNYPTYNIEVVGVPNTGDQVINNMSYSSTNGNIGGGWHLIGNPYASSLDWSKVASTATGINSVGYIWSNVNSQYVATNLLTNQNIVPAFEGFFIQVNSATNNITFHESDKDTSSTTYVRAQKEQPRLRLGLTNKMNGKYSPAAIDFIEDATIGFDAKYDARNLNSVSATPSIYFMSDTNELQVNAVNEKSLLNYVEIYLKSTVSDSMQLTIEEVPELLGCPKLYDALTGEHVALEKGKSYSFWFDAKYSGRARFLFYVEDNLVKLDKRSLSCYGSNDGELEVQFSALKNDWYLLKNLSDTLASGRNTSYKANDLGFGYYEVVWGSFKGSCALQVQPFSIDRPEEVVANFSCHEQSSLGRDIQIINKSRNGASYHWDFGNGFTSTKFSPQCTYERPGLYALKLRVENGKCHSSVEKSILIEENLVSTKESTNNQMLIFASSGNIHIKMKNNPLFYVEVYSVLGKKEVQAIMPANQEELKLNTSNFPSGIFLVSVKNHSGETIINDKVWIAH